jgi:hypothetical protein
VARKADWASFDTAIWAVGGDAAGLEEAREAIREGVAAYPAFVKPVHRWVWMLLP